MLIEGYVFGTYPTPAEPEPLGAPDGVFVTSTRGIGGEPDPIAVRAMRTMLRRDELRRRARRDAWGKS